MSPPGVVVLDRRSRPRVLFSGDRLVEVKLPPGTRCIYPKGPLFPGPFDVLMQNEDELSALQLARLQLLLTTTSVLTQALRRAIFTRLPAVQGSSAITVDCPADVVVVGIPSFNAQHAGTFLNPLLMLAEIQRSVTTLGGTGSLLRKNGTLVILNPCTDRFDQRRHLAHRAFVHELLMRKKDPLQAQCEQVFTCDPALIAMHRHGQGCHPGEPFALWKQWQALRQQLARALVVGADNETIPASLGFETAGSIEEALYRARGDRTRELSVTCVHGPPWPLVEFSAAHSVVQDSVAQVGVA